MDDTTPFLSPKTMRSPLTDASNRINNCLTAITEQDGLRETYQYLTSPDPMSIVNSPLSPKGNAGRYCVSPAPDSRAGSKRNSTISAASVVSGKGKRKTHIGPWQLGKTLGSGATGRVRLAKHAVTGQTAAIKIVSKKSAAMTQSASIAAMDKNAGNFIGTGMRQIPSGIEREVVIMKLIEHPNVITLYDVWENRGELYLVLEYVEGGELFEYLSMQGPLPEEEAVRIFRQIIAGLGYCHRFNICHRDLKPENILLDAEHNVKIADFGMAALQPAGHWLHTSCGSPHYAAPEIIHGKKYRGDKADIWSCGVILYALLTGYLPFEGGDLESTLALVWKAEYDIPPYVSVNAADLIQRILQKKPEDRISLENMWKHPLLRTYERFHQVRFRHPLGPAPPLSAEDCGLPVQSRHDIDMDLLRNLQTLWHDVKPEQLIERLLNPRPTQERMFYNALVKFRNEQLENYQGSTLDYSASDYHHISRGQARLSKQLGNRPQSSLRRRSQLPVVKETGKRKAPSREPMSSGTVESYDPFRSPVHTILEAGPHCAQITIHRDTPRADEQKPGSNNIQRSNPFLDSDSDAIDCSQSPPFAILRNRKQAFNSVKSFQSKSSYSGSRRGLNTTTPRSASYKRNVCFRHNKNRSHSSISVKAKKIPSAVAESKTQLSEYSLTWDPEDPFSDRPDSPLLPAQPAVVRGAGVTIKNCSQPKKVRSSDIIWKDEARQVSHELSQICEEAFHIDRSMSTTGTDSTCLGSETPPTSASIASPETPKRRPVANNPKVSQAPRTPEKSPKLSRTGKEIIERRRQLIQTSTHEGSDTIPAYLVTVIGHLDRLIEEDKARQHDNATKTKETQDRMSDPFYKVSSEAFPLPIISEELNASPAKPKADSPGQKKEVPAISTNPDGLLTLGCEAKRSIRMVPQSSFQSIDGTKQLHVRKRRDDSARNSVKPDADSSRPPSTPATPQSRANRSPCDRDPIEEGLESPRRRGTRASDHKKWSWFRKSQVPEDTAEKTLREAKSLQSSPATVIVHEVNHTPDVTPVAHGDDDLKPRKASSDTLKGGFLWKLMKRKPSKNTHDMRPGAEPVSHDTQSANDARLAAQKPKKSRARRQRPDGKSQNWFARVFQFKPVTKVVALNTSKLKGRKDVYKMLREWKQFGVEEVQIDKANSVVYGRVGEVNILHLRPVEFSAEFYTVIEDGRQANLSLVRFKQERGAASSFNKVVDILCMAMKKQGLLVEDPIRAKRMTQILDAFPN